MDQLQSKVIMYIILFITYLHGLRLSPKFRKGGDLFWLTDAKKHMNEFDVILTVHRR